jgi:hypothetical protein
VVVFVGLIEFGKVGMIYLDAIENSRNRKIKLYRIVYVFFIVVSFVVGAFHWIDANSDKKIEQIKTALQDDNKQVVHNLREQTELNKEQLKNEMRRDISDLKGRYAEAETVIKSSISEITGQLRSGEIDQEKYEKLLNSLIGKRNRLLNEKESRIAEVNQKYSAKINKEDGNLRNDIIEHSKSSEKAEAMKSQVQMNDALMRIANILSFNINGNYSPDNKSALAWYFVLLFGISLAISAVIELSIYSFSKGVFRTMAISEIVAANIKRDTIIEKMSDASKIKKESTKICDDHLGKIFDEMDDILGENFKQRGI